MSTSSPTLVTKRSIAFSLALIAIVACVYAVTQEWNLTHPDQQIGMATALAATADSGQPAYKMYLKLDTLAGEAQDDGHRGEIVIDSFTWGESRSMGAKNPTMEGMKVTMPISKASPKMFLYTAGGLKISRATLSVRKAGGGEDILKWILTDAQIVDYRTVGNTHGDGIMDQIILVPGKVEVEYKPADNSGLQKAGWDQRTGKSVSY